jgi:hypothetical protein
MGALFKIPGGIVYFIGGLWGFFICLGIISDAIGFWGAAAAFILLPITVYLAPWYAALGKGNWFPLLVIYGSTFAAMILFAIGSAIDRK